MRHGRVLLVLGAALLFCAERVPAQGPIIVGPGRGVGFGPGPWPGFGFGYGPRVGFIIGGYAPLAYPPYPYYPGVVYRNTNITIVNPPAQQPQPPPINVNVNVNVNLPGADLRDEDHPDKIIIRPGQKVARAQPAEKAEPPAEAPLPGEKAGDFRALRPEDRARAQRPDALEEAARPPALIPDRPAPRAEPGRPGEDFVVLGKAAFGEREHGRAERRFRQAVQAAPNEPVAHFYLAQAQFALGKYREAVGSIHEGLRLRADWPTNRFRARELYGANGDDFVEHLRSLDAALVRTPDDPVLLFLCAYQLWFDNREAEARVLFRRALPFVTEPRFIALFLQAQQQAPVVRR